MSTETETTFTNHRDAVEARGIRSIRATDTRLPHDLRRPGWVVIRPMADVPFRGLPAAYGVVSSHDTREDALDAAARQSIAAHAQGGRSQDLVAEITL